MWRLYGADGDLKDYEIFTVPFLTVPEKLFSKVRNLTYRYMPNQLSLFPKETQQYDTWLLRELLNTSMLHNSIKNNWTLEQLNWKLHEAGDYKEWDGLTSLFVNISMERKNCAS
ncbi:MAG: hypothetical protein MR355_03720 [Lachnospiraceae bacterium]|nr:hypothetical protein [Lachnospiraceae bacterium]